jgi:hypothetical protein
LEVVSDRARHAARGVWLIGRLNRFEIHRLNRMRFPRRRKYGNRIVKDAEGQPFHSKRELARWRELKLLEAAGEIVELRRQVRVELAGRDGPIKYEGGRKAALVVDFVYVDKAGSTVWEDAKGFEPPLSKLKRAIARAMGIEVVLTR